MAEPDRAPLSVAHLIATSIVKTATRATPAAVDLAPAISEIELETQTAGASFLRLHLIDPDWAITRSPFLVPDKDGLLDPVEIEYPDGSFWRLCAADFSEDLRGPNLILTFEDRIIALLRDVWGPKIIAPNATTRAQVIKLLVDEAARVSGKPIKFVCPSLNKVQPVQTDTTTVDTPAGKTTAAAKANKKRHVHSRAAITIKGYPPTPTQRRNINDMLGAAEALKATELAVQALLCAAIGESAIGGDPNTNTFKYKGVLQADPAVIDTTDPAALTTAFLQGGKGFQGGGALILSKTVSDPGVIAYTVEGSRSNFQSDNAAARFYGQWLGEAKAIIAAYGGIAQGSGGTPRRDVGQLSRGTSDDPDEDSWACIGRLARDVGWFAFSNADTLFYMDGPDLIGQRPALYLDRDREDDRGRIMQLSGTFDNTAYLRQGTHLVKGKVQRRSKISRPTTPTEIRLQLVCGIDEFKAGDVIVFHNYGPANGRWIVTTAVRRCLADVFTTFTLGPSTAPSPEPQWTDTTSSSGTSTNPVTGDASIAGAAKRALKEKDRYAYREVRPIPDTLFGPAPRIMDCSGFATLCYKHAGAPDPNGAGYNGSGNTGTLIKGMRKTDSPFPGDLGFYGGTLQFPAHVTVYIGGGQEISMGKPGDPVQGKAGAMGPSPFLGYWTLVPA